MISRGMAECYVTVRPLIPNHPSGQCIMIYANIWLKVKNAADVMAIRELLTEQCRLSRAEPGCERFEVYHSTVDPQTFLLVERWASQAALDAHRLAHAYTTIYQPQVLPKVERTAHPCELVE